MAIRSSLWLAILYTAAASAAADYFPPPDSAGGWRTVSGAEQIRKAAGMDLAEIDAAFEYTKLTSQHGGLLVVRGGRLVYERYFGRGHREALPELASCGKAFTSLAVGIMLGEHAARFPQGLDQQVYSPEFLTWTHAAAGRSAQGRDFAWATPGDVGRDSRHQSGICEGHAPDVGEAHRG